MIKRCLLAVAGVLLLIFSSALVGAAIAPDTSSGWVALSFANHDVGAALESTGPESGGSCKLSLITTSDGGVHWSPALTVDRLAHCLEPQLTGDDLYVTAVGSWWVATAQGLYQGSVRSSSFRLLRTGSIDRGARADTVCAVAGSGTAIVAALAPTCGHRITEVLARSLDDGATWDTLTSFPLKQLAGSALDYGPPDELVSAGGVLYGMGWTRPSSPVASLEVARSDDNGRTWRTTALPCAVKDDSAGLLATSGNDLLAVCLGQPVGDGFEPFEVVSSTDSGSTWAPRCGNGGLGPKFGKCPSGYPSSVAIAPAGGFVMALSYFGDADVSFDSGRTWTTSKTFGFSNFLVSGDSSEVWLLPNGLSGDLYRSTNGARWSAIGLLHG